MFFGREFLFRRLSAPAIPTRGQRDARRRLRRNLDASVQALEGRMLLSHAGVVHARHSSQAIISKLDQKQRNGPRTMVRGTMLWTTKGKHGHRKDNASQVAAQDVRGGHGRGKDDGTGHDALDEEGAKRKWQG